MPQPPPKVAQTTRDNRHALAGKFKARLEDDVSDSRAVVLRDEPVPESPPTPS